MAIPRLYSRQPVEPGATLVLPAELSHHVRVLRLAAGDPVILFDGRGGEVPGTLGFDGKAATVTTGGRSEREAELAGHITLIQGLPGGDKMDWIVEKAVELGVSRLQPVSARRSVTQLSGARLDKRMQHWERIVMSASEQCGRNRLMALERPVTLPEAMSRAQVPLMLFCDPAAADHLADVLRAANNPQRLALVIGPEGGWDDAELESARRAGARAVRFGARVLRTETAGLAMVAAVTASLGW